KCAVDRSRNAVRLLRARRLLPARLTRRRDPVPAAVAARKEQREYEQTGEAAGVAACTRFYVDCGWHKYSDALRRAQIHRSNIACASTAHSLTDLRRT